MAAEQILDRSSERLLRQVCADLERRLRAGDACRTEQFLEANPHFARDPEAVLEIIYTEHRVCQQLGRKIDPAEWLGRFPQWRENLERLFEVDALIGTERGVAGFAETPKDHQSIWFTHASDLTERRVGPYELIDPIARGGMGIVYRARHTVLNRMVAVKMILGFAGGTELARFRHEAEAAARLQHPNIVQIYEVGDQNGSPFLAMELVDGESLQGLLARSPLTARAAAELVHTLARTIHYAHQRGIVHRDLKPANVLLQRTEIGDQRSERTGGRERADCYPTSDLLPKVTDFGLAKQLPSVDQPDRVGLTQTGSLVGTPEYMAPEQASGHSERSGPLTDVYALGAILYETLTCRPPFRAATALETLDLIRTQEPVAPSRLDPGLPRDLETICLKCLEKDPRKRYASADGLANDLHRFIAGEPITARPVGNCERVAKWARRRPAVASLLAGLLLVSALGLTGIVWQWLRAGRHLTVAVAAFESADRARQAESAERNRVEKLLYLHDMALAHHEYLSNNTEQARRLLDGCRADLRGWEWHYLNRLCHAELLTLRGHTLEVRSVSYSPDGKLIASASGMWGVDRQGEVKVWDATTGHEVWTLRGHPSAVFAVAFSPDGTTLASGGVTWYTNEPGSVLLWDIATGNSIESVQNVGDVFSLAYSPDGQFLAMGCSDKQVRVFDFRTKTLRQLSGHSDHVFTVTFTPDGSRLVTGSRDGSVRVWDPSDGRELLRIPARGDVRRISLSPDGSRLVISTYNGWIIHWNLAKNIEVARHLSRGGPAQAVFTPDGRTLGVVGSDGVTQLWQASAGTDLRTFHGHSSATLDAAFSPDGRQMATAGFDHTVRVWDLTSEPEPRPVHIPNSKMFRMAYSPDGKRLALVSGSTTISAISTGDPRRSIGMRLWDVENRRQLSAFPQLRRQVSCVAFSPDGKELATGSDDLLQIWDAESGAQVRSFEGHTGPVLTVAFSPDGRHLISGGSDKSLRLWDATTGEEKYSIVAHAAPISAIAFDHGGKHIVSAASDGSLKIWDATDGRIIASLTGHTDAIRAIALSHHGQLLASAGDDATIKIWDFPTALAAGQKSEPAQVLRGHNQPVSAIDFSSDDLRLVSISIDQTIKLWDVSNGQTAFTTRLLRDMPGRDAQVLFNPDGQSFVASLNSLWVFDLAEENYADEAARWQASRQRAIAWHEQSARACQLERDWFGTVFHFSQLIELEPETRAHYDGRVRAYLERGESTRAITDLEKILAIGGDNHTNWELLAVSRLASDDVDGYRSACETLLHSYGGSRDANVINAVAWACVIGSDATASPERVVQLAQRITARAPESPPRLNVLGAALCRAGRFEESLRCLDKSRELSASGLAAAQSWLFLALAHAKLGNTEEAREWLGKAATWIDNANAQFESPATRDSSYNWRRRIELKLLLREAELAVDEPSNHGSQSVTSPLP